MWGSSLTLKVDSLGGFIGSTVRLSATSASTRWSTGSSPDKYNPAIITDWWAGWSLRRPIHSMRNNSRFYSWMAESLLDRRSDKSPRPYGNFRRQRCPHSHKFWPMDQWGVGGYRIVAPGKNTPIIQYCINAWWSRKWRNPLSRR